MAYDSHQRIDHGQSDTAQNGHLVRFESLSGGLKYEHSTGQRSESHAREYQPEVYSVEVKSLETNDWKQGRDCPDQYTKNKISQQDNLNAGGVTHVSGCSGERIEKSFNRRVELRLLASPGANSEQHTDERHGVHRENNAHTCKWDQKTAQRRTDGTGQVHLDSAQGDCGRELFLSHDLRYRSRSCGCLDRKTGPQQKHAREDDCGGQSAQKSAAGQQARA